MTNISSQFTTSTKKWETTIKGHAIKLFWILAAIAAVWTFILLVLRQAGLRWPGIGSPALLAR